MLLNNKKNIIIGINGNKISEVAKNKKNLINSIIFNHNKKSRNLKIKQNNILNDNTKNISNFLNYRIGVPNYQNNIQDNKLFYNTINISENNDFLKKEKKNKDTQNIKNLVFKKIKHIDFSNINYMQNYNNLDKAYFPHFPPKLSNSQYSNIYHLNKTYNSRNSSIDKNIIGKIDKNNNNSNLFKKLKMNTTYKSRDGINIHNNIKNLIHFKTIN